MASTPRIIHQTWKSAEIPEKYKAYVDSVKNFNPDFEYRLWTDSDIDTYVKNTVPQYYETYCGFASHIERVDFVRYVILYYIGGCYLDLDVQCLQSLAPLTDKNKIVLGYECSEHYFFNGGKPIVNNAVMISPPGQQFWADFTQYIIHHYSIKWYQNAVFRTGPVALTNFVASRSDTQKQQDEVEILSSCAFMPMSDYYNNRVVDGHPSISADCADLKDSYCIHKWSHAWVPVPFHIFQNKHFLMRLVFTLIVCAFFLYVCYLVSKSLTVSYKSPTRYSTTYV